MKKLLLITGSFLLMLISAKGYAQQLSFEEYYYTHNQTNFPLQSIVGYRTVHNWYLQARYDYEDLRTASFYGGRTFETNTKNTSFNFTPLLGAVIGKFNGGSAGLNMEIDYKKLYLSSQVQYTFSIQNNKLNYFYNWSEAGIELNNLLYTGLSAEQTIYANAKEEIDPGLFIAFTYKKWAFPFYIFNRSDNRKDFVIGVNWAWDHLKTAPSNISRSNVKQVYQQ